MEEDEALARVSVPGGGRVLRLFRQGGEFSLRVGAAELMHSAVHDSEDALGEIVCSRLLGKPDAVVLIGGLGMGFTLAAALKTLGPSARVVVSELIAGVVDWNRGPLAHLAGRPLSDARVAVRVEDVGTTLRGARARFDAVLLDVDNGPEGLTRASNDWLYSDDGLAAAYEALRPEGVLAVWSASPERSFAMRLGKVGFEAEEVRVPTGAGDRNVIWLATRSS